jgi:hypothetical protein
MSWRSYHFNFKYNVEFPFSNYFKKALHCQPFASDYSFQNDTLQVYPESDGFGGIPWEKPRWPESFIRVSSMHENIFFLNFDYFHT